MRVHALRAVLCRGHEEDRPEDNAKEEEEEENQERKRSRTKSKKLRKKVASILGDKSDNRCACCLKPVALSRTVRCCDCGARACQKKCSRSDQRLGWCCLFCYQQRAWLQSNPRWIDVFDRLNIEPDIARNLATSETDLLRRRDNAAVDAKSAVYTAIRKLVDHAVDEVQRLPSLENSGSSHSDAHRDFSRKSQDNLLATVIVNKVIAKCQSEQTGNGNVLNLQGVDNQFFKASETSRVDGQSQSCDRSLELLRKNLQPISVATKFTQTQPSELSSLMYEERIEEVASYISEKYISNGSYDDLDFCNSHRVPFPELGIDIINQCSDLLDDDAIDTSYAKTLSLPHSWKENWYFRKRSDGTKSAVSMFVPNSNADYRALIGDKDIDETSDLSEYSTYSDDEAETDLVLTIKNTFVEDNGRAAECNGVAQSTDASAAAAVKSIPRSEDKLFNVAENTTDENFNSSFKPSSRGSHSSSSPLKCEIPGKPSEFQEENNEIFKEDQRDRECAEHNTLVPRRHCNGIHDDANISSVSVAADVSAAEQERTDGRIENGVAIRINEGTGLQNGLVPQMNDDDDLVDDFNLFAPPIPGSIADREHKKWQNAVPIENNPYSSENIQKRLVQRQYSPISTVLPSSSYDITINGNAFHALGEADKDSSPDCSEDISITKISGNNNNNNEEKNENVSDANGNNDEPISRDDAREILHNDQLQTSPANQDASTRNDNNDKPSDSEEYQAPTSKLTNGHRAKNALSNTQLIKSYFENGERKEDTRDVSPKKGKNIDGNNKVIRKKKLRSRQEDVKGKNSTPLEASLTSEVEHDADGDSIDDKIIALPSVKKIVQAFNEKIQEKSLSNVTPQKAPNKSESGDDEQVVAEATTHVRRTQLHLHSLTARSLSREFREGLRQVPKKV